MRVHAQASSLALTLGLALVMTSAAVAAPSHAWTDQFGTTETDAAYGVAVDGRGNVVVVGETQGPLDGTPSSGDSDAFVRKYKANGRLLWTRQFGSNDYEVAWDVAIDPAGNIVIVGETSGSIDGAPSLGGSDAFVRKYRPNGRLTWSRQFGTDGADGAWAVGIGPNGVIVVGGRTSGAIAGTPSNGGLDAFVHTFGRGGGRGWVRQFGSAAGDMVTGVSIDGRGRIALCGITAGALPGATAQGGYDAFVRTHGPRGGHGWTRQFGTAGWDHAVDVAIGRRGRVVVVGDTEGSLEAPSKGESDAFVRIYGGKGALGWTRQFGTRFADSLHGVALDQHGHIHVAGWIGRGTDSSDAFMRKYRADGRPVWQRRIGAPGSAEGATDIAVDASRSPIVVGMTEGRLPQQTASGLSDAFVRKYRR